MPVLDGIGALTEIMRRRPTPVVMLSSLTQAGAEATLRCLELGAVDFVGKPSGSISLDIEKVAAELIGKVKAAAGARLHARRPPPAVASQPTTLPSDDTASGEARPYYGACDRRFHRRATRLAGTDPRCPPTWVFLS